MSDMHQAWTRAFGACVLFWAIALCAGCKSRADVTLPPNDAGQQDEGPEPEIVPADGGFEIVLPPAQGELAVEIGVPDADTGIRFAPFVAGGDIPFAGVGQVGLTARVGLRVTTPSGEPLERAIVRVDIVRVDDDTVEPARNRLRDSPTDLRCSDDGVCIYVPMHLQILHLNSRTRLDGTVVWVRATFQDADDPARSGIGYSWGVLRRLN